MEGYIWLHKRFKSWEWKDDPKMVALFIHFLLSANYQDSEWRGIKIKRGQFITGLKSLRVSTGISVQSLRSCIKKLKSTGEITVYSTNKFSIVSLVNWDKYQPQSTIKITSKPTNEQQTTNKQLTTANNINNINNKKSGAFSPPSLQEVKDYCTERNNKVNPDQFVNFYESKGWFVGKNKMKDWRAAVRTWEKRDSNNSGEVELKVPEYAKKFITNKK